MGDGLMLIGRLARMTHEIPPRRSSSAQVGGTTSFRVPAAASEESSRCTATRSPEILQDTGTPFTKVKIDSCPRVARHGNGNKPRHIPMIAGILSGGRLIHGALHPEFGHIKVPRQPGDGFAGVCPFHGDCLEGLASGPSIEARWGTPAAELPPDHPAWDTEAWYLAHGALSLLGIVSPARIIIGGGVSQASGFHSKTLLREVAAGYFPPLQNTPFVVAPELGQQAGIIGSLLLTNHC